MNYNLLIYFSFLLLHVLFCCCGCLFFVLLFVIRIKVISPELVLEVEARMRRNYLPTSLLPNSGGPTAPTPRKHSRHHATVKPHLPTVQEMQGIVSYSTNTKLNNKT